MSKIVDLLNDIDAIIKEPIKIVRPTPKNDADIIQHVRGILDIFESIPTRNEQINKFVELYEYFNEPIVNDFIHRHDTFKQVIIKNLKAHKQKIPYDPRITSLTIRGCELEE